ncbi:MAG: nucleotidyl transferase AbiEii/AbiGii toxin family protein [Thermoanaerobaculia bacterium]
MDFELTKRVLAALERERVEYLVFGAVAVNLLGLARATEDLDIFIAPSAENIGRLRAALHSVFDDPHIDEITAEDLLGEYPAVQYAPPEGVFRMDILTRLGEAFGFEDLESQRVEFDGMMVSVATPLTLYRMKKGTVRPKDWGDAAALKARYGLKDE